MRCRRPRAHWLAAIALLAFVQAPAQANAEAGDEATDATPAPEQGTWVTVNVGVELHAIERAARDVAQSMAALSESVRTLAKSPSLSDDQKRELLTIIGRVDGLSGRVVEAIDRLPAAVEQTREPVVAMASELASDVRITVFVTLGLLLLVVIAVLVGIYYFVLKPSRALVTHSIGRVSDLFGVLERTADLVAQTNAAQLRLARRMGLPVDPDEPGEEAPSTVDPNSADPNSADPNPGDSNPAAPNPDAQTPADPPREPLT